MSLYNARSTDNLCTRAAMNMPAPLVICFLVMRTDEVHIDLSTCDCVDDIATYILVSILLRYKYDARIAIYS